ncbi:uncharacterized protein METZ01_LOCUS215007 [marine metagenome]|uniref:Uncharacterized protein n=1 Tax=marine metagenome TaxID=408172 RepID=A0A382FIW7_9ZZZZ
MILLFKQVITLVPRETAECQLLSSHTLCAIPPRSIHLTGSGIVKKLVKAKIEHKRVRKLI